MYAINTIAAEMARLAHYLLGSGFDGVTKRDAARQLAALSRRLNALAPRPYSDENVAILLGRAVDLTPRRFGMVIFRAPEDAAGSVVLAVDPAQPRSGEADSRSTPTEAVQ